MNLTKQKFIEKFISDISKLDKNDVDIKSLTQLKYDHLPKSIFKFCSFDEKNRNIGNLQKNIVWLNDPSNFNDPYEFSSKIDIKVVLKTSYANKINVFLDSTFKDAFTDEEKRMLRKDNRSYDEIVSELISQGRISQDKLDDFEYRYIGVIKQSIENEDIKKLFKVSSFTERNDSLLMWSHYSHNHTGFCIEYDIESLPITHPLTKSLYPVVYSKEFVDMTEYYLHKTKNPNLDYLLPVMIKKSLEWEYENEWRLLIIDGTEKGIEFPMPKPKAIYLGSKFNPDNLKEIYTYCSENKIGLYRMKLDSSKYELIPEILEGFGD